MEELNTIKVLENYEKLNPETYRVISKFQDYYFDSFMDALGFYVEWRPKTKDPKNFLDRLLKKWGVTQWIPEYPNSVIKKIVKNDRLTLSINDEATISIALSALLVDGVIRKKLKERAIVCINRQASDVFLVNADKKNDEMKIFWENLKTIVCKA